MTALPRELPPNVRVYHIPPPPRERLMSRKAQRPGTPVSDRHARRPPHRENWRAAHVVAPPTLTAHTP